MTRDSVNASASSYRVGRGQGEGGVNASSCRDDAVTLNEARANLKASEGRWRVVHEGEKQLGCCHHATPDP